MRTLLKSTSRGQVTLPKQWRDQFKTKTFVAEIRDDSLVLSPFELKAVPRPRRGGEARVGAIVATLEKIRHS